MIDDAPFKLFRIAESMNSRPGPDARLHAAPRPSFALPGGKSPNKIA